jgi:hemerythrin-like domain-containing protein
MENSMALTLTNLYLEESQRKFLAKRAKAAKTNLSVEARRAIDACKDGISLEELDLLDTATKKAADDIAAMNDEIAAMNQVLDKGQARADRFFAEIAKLKDAA